MSRDTDRLDRLIRHLEWAAAAGFLVMRPVVTGPLVDLDARIVNLFLSILSWSPLLLAMLRTARGGDAVLRAPRFLAPAAACLAALGAATWLSPDKAFAIPRSVELGGFMALFLWMSQQGRAAAVRGLWCLVAGAAICVAIGLFQAGGGLALMREEIRGEIQARRDPASPWQDPAWMTEVRESRLTTDEIFGTFFPFYSNTYAGYLAMLLAVLAGLLHETFRARAASLLRVLLGALLASAFYCLARTGSTGGFVSAAAGFAVYVARVRNVPWKSIGIAGAIVSSAVVVAVVSGWRHPSIDVRLGYWHGTALLAWNNFWTGVGPGSAHLAYDAFRPAGAGDVRFAHNALLELLAEGGILLAAVAAWLFLTLLFSRENRGGRRDQAEGAIPETRDAAFAFPWGAAAIAAGCMGAALWKLFPRTGYPEAEAILVACAAVLALALWTLGAAPGRLIFGPAALAGVEAGLAAGAVHLATDFGLQVQGLAGVFIPLAGVLAAARRDRPVPLNVGLPQSARFLLIGAAGLAGFLLLFRYPIAQGIAAREIAAFENARAERPGPDELRDLTATHLAAARDATPWNTEILVEHARVLGFLWAQDRKEEDRTRARELWALVASRRPWSGQPCLEQAFLVRTDDPPAKILASWHLLARAKELLPRWPRPRLELARRTEAILANESLLATWAADEEIPVAAARNDLTRRAARFYREALELDRLIPDPHHKLDESERRMIRQRLGQE